MLSGRGRRWAAAMGAPRVRGRQGGSSQPAKRQRRSARGDFGDQGVGVWAMIDGKSRVNQHGVALLRSRVRSAWRIVTREAVRKTGSCNEREERSRLAARDTGFIAFQSNSCGSVFLFLFLIFDMRWGH